MLASSPKRAKMLEAIENTTSVSIVEQIQIQLRIKLLSENGRAPERGSAKAAGYDLFR